MMKLILQEKKQEAENIWSFVFSKPEGLDFQSGQFLHLFVPHDNPDDRGTKRFFTVAASPTEDFLMITTKIIEDSSSFKKALFNSPIGATFEAVEPAGPFVLPKENTPCVLIAGGIGVTPYRSMAKFAADKKLLVPLKVIHANKTPRETPYRDFFQELEKQNSNFKVFYTMTEAKWEGRVGRIDEKLIREVAGNLGDNLYYLSGPQPMVEAFQKLLENMDINTDLIKLDYFPGYDNEKLL